VNNQAAVTAHWVVGRSYEFFRDFGINGLYNDGRVANVWICPSLENNAFYTQTDDNQLHLVFGQSTVNERFLTDVDIVGHEYGHGVSRLMTTGLGDGLNFRGLSQNGEARALNEGLSDIFGKAMERRLLPDVTDWRILDGFGINQIVR
jgi:Zn-dependent metalloprotease